MCASLGGMYSTVATAQNTSTRAGKALYQLWLISPIDFCPKRLNNLEIIIRMPLCIPATSNTERACEIQLFPDTGSVDCGEMLLPHCTWMLFPLSLQLIWTKLWTTAVTDDDMPSATICSHYHYL
jgi:hypothetical protein